MQWNWNRKHTMRIIYASREWSWRRIENLQLLRFRLVSRLEHRKSCARTNRLRVKIVLVDVVVDWIFVDQFNYSDFWPICWINWNKIAWKRARKRESKLLSGELNSTLRPWTTLFRINRLLNISQRTTSNKSSSSPSIFAITIHKRESGDNFQNLILSWFQEGPSAGN